LCWYRSGQFGELAAHLLHRLGFDLADALGRHAVFGGQLVQRGGFAVGQPAALDDGAAAVVELGQRVCRPSSCRWAYWRWAITSDGSAWGSAR
jgi:hypothetical protein